MAQIIGQPKILPLYRTVTDNGNNTTFTIVRWVGVRILYVKLTGRHKQVTFQPANVVSDGAIAAEGDQGTSEFVYARPTLIR